MSLTMMEFDNITRCIIVNILDKSLTCFRDGNFCIIMSSIKEPCSYIVCIIFLLDLRHRIARMGITVFAISFTRLIDETGSSSSLFLATTVLLLFSGLSISNLSLPGKGHSGLSPISIIFIDLNPYTK